MTYPILFNKKENWDYVGEIPEIENYNIRFLHREKRDEIIKIHEELKKNNYIFDIITKKN